MRATTSNFNDARLSRLSRFQNNRYNSRKIPFGLRGGAADVEGDGDAASVEVDDEVKDVVDDDDDEGDNDDDDEDEGSGEVDEDEASETSSTASSTNNGSDDNDDDNDDDENKKIDNTDSDSSTSSTSSTSDAQVFSTATAHRSLAKKYHDSKDYTQAASSFSKAGSILAPLVFFPPPSVTSSSRQTYLEEYSICKIHEALCLIKIEDYEAAKAASTKLGKQLEKKKMQKQIASVLQGANKGSVMGMAMMAGVPMQEGTAERLVKVANMVTEKVS
ncbi:hypothetical protein TL16_g01268 [Triparma laevis f. inornata]|uniref:Uncharacterized protein n=1 Tax=Triparma laevis f. inornata TaxID=1714386 RepID=A0A9W6ZLD3_9STRA|nr:hypothetical protein TL16_g01268 [Triparma laevis f. inornata]